MRELAAIPGLRILPIDRHESIARRLPFVTAVEVPRAILDVALDVPPDAVRALAARATVVGTADLHPDLARLIVAVLPAAIPPAWVGDPHALPGLADTQLPVNEDARQFLDEGPTPLEGSLPFEVASPLSRIYLIVLPPFRWTTRQHTQDPGPVRARTNGMAGRIESNLHSPGLDAPSLFLLDGSAAPQRVVQANVLLGCGVVGQR